MKKITSALLFIGLSLASAASRADDHGRCGFMANHGVVSKEAARSSNAWGVKCHKITRDYADALDAVQQYVIYVYDGCKLIDTPPKECDPCDLKFGPGADCKISVAGTCSAGCYPPSEQLQFGDSVMSIENAFRGDVRTVTALTERSTSEMLSYAPQAIQAFVSGETTESLYTLVGEAGQRLRVTAEHPMVSADGSLVRASTLQAGDALLGADGHLIPLAEVNVTPYSGWVWNIKPVSAEKTANILVANGYLTGSSRFQNEWANDAYRLSQRDRLDVSGL